MKSAFAHDWLNGMRGGEKVLEHLGELFPDAPVYTLHSEKEALSKTLKNRTIINSFIQNLPLKKNFYRYYLPLFPMAVERFSFDPYKLVISTSHCVVKGIKPGPETCHICYSFTPMRYVWTFSDEYFGQNPIKKLLMSPFLHYLKKWDRQSSSRVYRFIAISQTTQKRIRSSYGRDSLIIHPPCNFSFQAQNDKKDFFLVLSALVPYKKIDLAIRVFNELKLPLTIAGTGSDDKRLKHMAGPNISFTGWIPEQEKIRFLSQAKALIFPGIEDFGITPLEAIAFGTPVISYKKGGVLETITEDTGLFFEEQTEKSLKEAVQRFEKKPFVINKEPAYFRDFSPEIFKQRFKDMVDETMDAFQKGKEPF